MLAGFSRSCPDLDACWSGWLVGNLCKIGINMETWGEFKSCIFSLGFFLCRWLEHVKFKFLGYYPYFLYSSYYSPNLNFDFCKWDFHKTVWKWHSNFVEKSSSLFRRGGVFTLFSFYKRCWWIFFVFYELVWSGFCNILWSGIFFVLILFFHFLRIVEVHQPYIFTSFFLWWRR